MANYRRRNYSPLQPDPVIPKPVGVPAFITDDCQPLDGGVYLHWEYKAQDADTLNGYWVRVTTQADKATVIREVYVSEPDTDLDISGLANKTGYTATVTAANPTGESVPSPGFNFTPDVPLIPAPVLKTLTGGDGEAIATWSWGSNVDGFTYDWISYEAVNEVGATVTEHVVGGEFPNESGRLPLANDHDWKVALVAVASNDSTKKQYVSAVSNAITIHTEQKLPPYKPRLTGAQIDSGNAGLVLVSFAPGIQNVTATRPVKRWRKWFGQDNGRNDITAWQVRVQKDAQVYTYDIEDGTARGYTTPKVGLGTWLIDVRAKNAEGFSDWSNQLSVTYKPTDSRPFTSDKPFSFYESASYGYAIFDPGNDPGKGWYTNWTCTRTNAGDGVSFDVLAIGAGGGGKGVTATFGKGGNGGGGEATYGFIGPSAGGTTFTVMVGIGGSTAIDPNNSVVKQGSTSVTAVAGKSASSGSDASGNPRTQVRAEWRECALAFGWLLPDSEYVGGVAQEGKQGFPNGLGWGCAGVGTKNNQPGKGVEGLVIVRWAK